MMVSKGAGLSPLKYCLLSQLDVAGIVDGDLRAASSTTSKPSKNLSMHFSAVQYQ